MTVEASLLFIISLLSAIYLWIIRVKLKLIWQLNGAFGILQQPLLCVIVWQMLDPNKLLGILGFLRKYFKQPICFLFGTKCLIYVDEPVLMEKILNSPACLDKTILQDGIFARNGLLHAKGQKWKIRRKQLDPTFSYSVLMSFYPTFNNVANSLQLKLNEYIGVRKFHEIEDIVSRAVLVTTCQTTMGTETNFLENDENEIAQTYKRLLNISSIKAIKPWLQIDFLFRMTNFYNTDRQLNNLVADFVKEIVSRKHAKWKENKQNPNTSPVDAACEEDQDGTQRRRKRNFIEQIFQLAENGEITLQDVMDESNSMVLVATESVSNSITLALLCLAMYPENQNKLRQEIYSTIPNGDVSSVSGDNLRNMKYLDMVVNEALRLLSTIPMTVRSVSEDFILKDSIVVPKGTFIVLDSFSMQRNSTYWGPMAKEFYPEHFLSDNIAKRHPYAFVPFMKGLRSCIGTRYSIFLSKIILTKLIYSYKFETETRLQDLKFTQSISLKLQQSDRITFKVSRVD